MFIRKWRLFALLFVISFLIITRGSEALYGRKVRYFTRPTPFRTKMRNDECESTIRGESNIFRMLSYVDANSNSIRNVFFEILHTKGTIKWVNFFEKMWNILLEKIIFSKYTGQVIYTPTRSLSGKVLLSLF